MSWFMDRRGRKVWVEREELVYTVDEPNEDVELPLQDLTYLAVESKQAVYQENMVDEDGSCAKGKKAKERTSGRQRGFVVKVSQDERTKVTSSMQKAVDKLFEKGIVSRVDIDDSWKVRKGKKKRQPKQEAAEVVAATEEEPAVVEAPPVVVAVNEVNVRTSARCQHHAHGTGFQLEVTDCDGKQRILCFTQPGLTHAAWYAELVEAIEVTGSRAMEGALAAGPSDAKESGGKAAGPKDLARTDADDWLSQMMGRCMVGPSDADKQKNKEAKSLDAEVADGVGGDAKGEPGSVDGTSKRASRDAASNGDTKSLDAVPPWLQMSSRRSRRRREEEAAALEAAAVEA